MMRLTVLVIGLTSAFAPGTAQAEQVPGFYPGNWAFMTTLDPTEADVAKTCRETMSIVTAPNDAITIVFEKIDPPEASSGKTLRGKIVYKEICPVVEGETLICPGRDLASSGAVPTLTQYTFSKRPDGSPVVTAKTQSAEPQTYYPRPCSKSVIEGLMRDAIVPEEAGLKP
jgi:hypothetical protein